MHPWVRFPGSPHLKTPVVLEVEDHVVLAFPTHPVQDRFAVLLESCELMLFQMEVFLYVRIKSYVG